MIRIAQIFQRCSHEHECESVFNAVDFPDNEVRSFDVYFVALYKEMKIYDLHSERYEIHKVFNLLVHIFNISPSSEFPPEDANGKPWLSLDINYKINIPCQYSQGILNPYRGSFIQSGNSLNNHPISCEAQF